MIPRPTRSASGEPKLLTRLTVPELLDECEDWMDRAMWATTALGEAKDLLRAWRDGETPDTSQLAAIRRILGEDGEMSQGQES